MPREREPEAIANALVKRRKRKIGTLKSGPAFHRARITQAVELQLHGLTQPVVAKMMGVSTAAVHKWNKIATRQGIIEEVRERLTHSILAKAADAYEHILGADVATLTENHKGYAIKLKAAKDIAEGVGALRKEALAVTKRGTVTLDAYYERREIAAGAAEVTSEQHDLQPAMGIHSDGASQPERRRLGVGDVSDGGELPILDGEIGGGSDSDGAARGREVAGGAGSDGAAEVDARGGREERGESGGAEVDVAARINRVG